MVSLQPCSSDTLAHLEASMGARSENISRCTCAASAAHTSKHAQHTHTHTRPLAFEVPGAQGQPVAGLCSCSVGVTPFTGSCSAGVEGASRVRFGRCDRAPGVFQMGVQALRLLNDLVTAAVCERP